MSNSNVTFCRRLLSILVEDFRTEFPHIRTTKDAWVINAGFRDHWEFHAENRAGSYYWHGHADNAYDARYRGWSAWRERETEAPARAHAAGFAIRPYGEDLFVLWRSGKEPVGKFACMGDAADEAVRLKATKPTKPNRRKGRKS